MLFPSPPPSDAGKPAKVVCFVNSEWGFSDAALPKLKHLLKRHPNLRCRVTHSSLTAYFDTENEAEFPAFISDIQKTSEDKDFEDFRISIAEGKIHSPTDFTSLELRAIRNLKNEH